MAETFKNQVDALTGFGSTEDTALSDWLTAGAKELIHVFPPALLEKCKDFSTLDTSPNSLTNIDTRGHVFSVIRSDGSINQIASYIDSKFNGQVTDSTSLYFATVGAPKYTIYGTNLYVYPTPSDAQPAYIEHVQFPTVAHGDSSITKFPDEAEHLVVLYASIKAFQRMMIALHTNTDINTALTAVTDAVAQAEIAATKFASAATDSQFDTNATWDATNSQLTIVKEALDKAKTLMTDDAAFNALSGVTDDVTNVSALYWLGEEDTEMVQAALNMVQVEIQRAQAEISHWTAIGDMRTKEINAALSEAGGYVQEASTRMSRDTQKYQWYQSEQAKLQQDYDKGVQILIGGTK